jgi:glycosyltransferase involved in cell wall biosynthesis
MISHAYPPTFGGVESHVWDICHHLARRDHEVLVVTGGEDAVPPGRLTVDSAPLRPLAAAMPPGFGRLTADTAALRPLAAAPTIGSAPVHRYGTLSVQVLLNARASLPHDAASEPRLLADIRAVLAAEFDSFGPDIVHVHNAHHYGPEIARACLDLAAVPVVNAVHDRVGEYLYPDVLDWPWAMVVFVSEYLRGALPTSRPSAVRWLGIELDTFRPDGPRDHRLEQLDRPVIFHPARLLRWKGVECGVRAFARAHPTLGGSLVLCASENIVDDPCEVAALRRELVTMAGSLGVGDAVHFMSFDRQRIPDAYRAADLIWYPTIDDEPLGLVPLEAMACGVPLVVSRSGGMRETVDDGETGLVVPRDDADALAAAAVKVLSDRTLRSSLVHNGLARAAHFGNAAYVDWLEDRYRAITASVEGVRTT